MILLPTHATFTGREGVPSEAATAVRAAEKTKALKIPRSAFPIGLLFKYLIDKHG